MRRSSYNKIIRFIVIVFSVLNFYIFIIKGSGNESESVQLISDNYSSNDDDKIDWHNHEFMAYEASRIGLGENGAPIVLTDPTEIEENEKGYRLEGIYTVVNDKISPNRSLPDVRLAV